MPRPKIKIPLDTSDYIMEIAGAVFLILMIGWPLYYYPELPDTIPVHFNAAGEPDGFSHKNSLWTLPGIGLVMYVGMFILNKYPHLFNYPTEITAENAEQQYRIATKMVRTLNTVITAGFFYIGYSTIQTALSQQDGLGIAFLPVFLVLIFGTTGIYFYRVFKK